MHSFLLHNGELHRAEDKLLSPGQTGFMNGWGVFSTIRVSQGVMFAFERHHARLQRDAERMRVPFPFTPQQLAAPLEKLIQANQAHDATLRVCVVRNRGGLFEGTGIQRDSDLVAFTADLNRWGAGVKLSYVPNARLGASEFAGAKVTSWVENLVRNERAHEDGFDEVILLNERGAVSECTSANIFAIQGDRVVTPPLATSGCLPGVTRAVLLEEIRLPGLNIEEAALTPQALEASDGSFITSTTRDLLPILNIDGREMRQAPAIVDRLQTAFAEFRAAYVAHRKLTTVA